MQDEGAAIMGLGHTLMEQYIWDEAGRIRNLGAIDYRIPTSMDLPLEMLSDTIENEDGPGPYGAKGMSEGAVLAGRVGRGRRCSRRDRRRNQGPAALPGTRVARAARTERHVNEGLLGVLVLFLIAGGGIIVLDTVILRRLRRNADERKDEPEP